MGNASSRRTRCSAGIVCGNFSLQTAVLRTMPIHLRRSVSFLSACRLHWVLAICRRSRCVDPAPSAARTAKGRHRVTPFFRLRREATLGPRPGRYARRAASHPSSLPKGSVHRFGCRGEPLFWSGHLTPLARGDEMDRNKNRNRLIELMIASGLAVIIGAWLLAFAAVWLWSALT